MFEKGLFKGSLKTQRRLRIVDCESVSSYLFILVAVEF